MSDKAKLAMVGLGTAVSLVASYFIYKKASSQMPSAEQKTKSKSRRELRRALRSAQQIAKQQPPRIVGANKGLRKNSLNGGRSGLDTIDSTSHNGDLSAKMLQRDLRNAKNGTKTIYFDNNDLMYTEDEVISDAFSNNRSFTKIKVRVPENERQRLAHVKSQAKVHHLRDFINQINHRKSNYIHDRRYMHGTSKKAMSQRPRYGPKQGSYLSTTSGDQNSLGVLSNPTLRIEPRHFKSKEGSVWLNMFETISNNYCLTKD